MHHFLVRLLPLARLAEAQGADRAAATGAFEAHRYLNLLGALLGEGKVPHAVPSRCFRHASGEALDRNSGTRFPSGANLTLDTHPNHRDCFAPLAMTTQNGGSLRGAERRSNLDVRVDDRRHLFGSDH
jgi:hypothetical protein